MYRLYWRKLQGNNTQIRTYVFDILTRHYRQVAEFTMNASDAQKFLEYMKERGIEVVQSPFSAKTDNS